MNSMDFYQREHFKSKLISKIPFRLHMFVMLVITLLVGVLANKLYYYLGITEILYRHPASVVTSYLTFLMGWWFYIHLFADRSSRNPIDLDLPFSLPTQSGSDLDRFVGQGGASGGAGASGSWTDASTDPTSPFNVNAQAPSVVSSTDSGSGVLGDIDIDDDHGAILLIIIGAALILSVFFAGIYLVYESPVILSEGVIEVIFAGTLYRRAKGFSELNKWSHVLKKTWIPFGVVFLLTVVLGLFRSSTTL